MKHQILRILIKASLVSLIVGSLVVIIGLTREWKTPAEFSNGFFFAGAILIFIGLISYMGYSRGSLDAPAGHLDPAERSDLAVEDTSRGKRLMIFFTIPGVLLFGLSLLIARLF
jgi:uncharacterized membrane protein